MAAQKHQAVAKLERITDFARSAMQGILENDASHGTSPMFLAQFAFEIAEAMERHREIVRDKLMEGNE